MKLLKKNTTSVGNQAETLACDFLRVNGYKIIDRNYKDRFCEIDIIASTKREICFVEVKYRRRSDFGGAISSVTPQKFLRMQNAASYWLANSTHFQNHQPRLDVITITGDLTNPELVHLENVN